MFLAVVSMPQGPDAIARAASAAGMVRADAQRRLAGILPRVLMVAAAEEIEAAQAALEAAGFRTVAFDPRLAPGDDERIIARSLQLVGRELVVVAGVGVETRHPVPLDAIGLVQRAIRSAATSQTVATKEQRLALGTAVLTGGLKWTKTVEKTAVETTETRDPLLVLQRTDGGEDVVLSEHRLDYRFLGGELAPTSHANFETMVALIRRLAPRARFDDRAARPGFVAGIPMCSADPLDVALHLVQLADMIEHS